MVFGYSYKTSDSVWHESELDAPDRESVFAALKGRGIKPIKVWEKEARRTNKRWAAIVVLSLAVVGLVGYIVNLSRAQPDMQEVTEISVRHFIPDVDNTYNTMIRTFLRPSEAYLALYAMPGEPVNAPFFTEVLAGDFARGIDKRVMMARTDSDGVRELRAVVEGMKEDLARYIRIGGGIRDYVKMLEERQASEIAWRKKTIAEMEEPLKKGETVEMRRNRVNSTLRALGMREMGQ